MLKSKENVRKISNRLIMLMAIIVVLGIGLIMRYSRAENREIQTMAIEQFGQMKNGLRIADVELNTGTVNPIYKPKWTKVSSSISENTISVVLKGTASESQTIDSNTEIDYSSTVTTNLTADDILVYINGELDGDTDGDGVLESGETPSITKNVTALDPSTGLTEATHTLTLSGFEGLTRQTGKPYKEWSGNISIKILGRGEDADTYDKNTLVDIYGNQSMMETDEADGTWIDIIYKDDDSTTNTNVSGIMFTDFIKPEFTYISSATSTIIDHGEEKVTIIFDVVDKYFKETDLASNANGSLITVIVDDNANANTPITKVLTKVEDIEYTVNGATAKIGERYQLVITGLDQGDGELYSGPMTLSFPAGIIRDHAGNENNATSITLGINEPSKNDDGFYIPAGYTQVSGTNLSNGLVIQDALGNQFVWVEVPKTETVYSTAGLNITEFTASEFAAIETDLFNYSNGYNDGYTDEYSSETALGLTETQYNQLKQQMLRSIYKHGGFYVGRYETGIEDSYRSGAADTTQIPVIKKDAYPYNYVTTRQAQHLARRFTTQGYETSVMFGLQVNLVLKYLQDSGAAEESELNEDSTEWGNYKNNAWTTASNSNAKYSTNGTEWVDQTYGAKASGTSVLLSTGASEEFKKKNIYDLAGNVWERTLEKTTSTGTPSAYHGGGYDGSGISGAAYYRSCYTSDDTNNTIGFRIALFKAEPTIVDVVDPVWKAENIDINHTNKNVTVDLVAYDKYYASNSLDIGDITVNIDGVDLTTAITDVNVKKELNTPTVETLVVGSELPSEYQQLEYIESTGTQYLDSGVNGDNDNLTIDITYNLLEFNIYYGIFGNYKDEYTSNCWRLIQTNVDDETNYVSTNTLPNGGTALVEIEKNTINNVVLSKDKIIINGNERQLGISTEGAANNSNILIFTQRVDTNRISTMRLYNFKVKDNNTIIRNLVPCYRKSDNVAGMYDTVNGVFYTNQGTGEFVKGPDGGSEATGVRYTLTLSDWQEALRQSGKNYLEWSGTTKITIAEGTITDQYTNTSNEQEFTLGHVDFIKPEIVEIEPTAVIQAQDEANKTETIVFTATDKYLVTSDMITKDEITIYVDEEDATSALRDDAQLTYEAIDGGYKYTLVIKNLEKTRNAKNYKDWSGTVSIKIAEGAVKDTNTPTANVNDETTIIGDYVDYINPNLKYTHQSTDISTGSKTYTMTFDITDKYYDLSKVLTIDDIANENIVILMQNGQYQRDANGEYILDEEGKKKPIVYDLKDEPVTITLTPTAKYATNVKVTNASTGLVETIENHQIGHTYTLTISNLEKFEIKNGLTTADYSGVITLSLQPNKVQDRKGNGNVASTITSGISLSEGVESGTATTVDVVDPLIEKFNPVTDAVAQTTTVTIRGTDTYFDADDVNASTLTTEEIKVFINGRLDGDANGNGVLDAGEIAAVTKTLTSETQLKESRLANGVETPNIQYGVEYLLTLTGYAQNVNQIKIQIVEDAIKDETGNGNKETEFMLYNCLETTTLINDSNGLITDEFRNGGFLDGNNETGIARKDIEKVVFETSLSGSTAEDVKKVWDVSAQNDGSIKAWTTQSSAPYTVHIGSDYEIFANKNSRALFASIGYSTACTATEAVSGLNLLNTSSVTNMSWMFGEFGFRAMTSLNLGNFDTKNVRNMECMFHSCGYIKMKSLNLGISFNTSRVEYMNAMFAQCGCLSMTSLDLSSGLPASNTTQFNTNNVINMNFMFAGCGYTAMTTLNLGTNFNTSKVTTMSYMFYTCGNTAMTSLDLSSGLPSSNTTQFNTSRVIDMSYMFQQCGYTAMTSLNLGTNFDTSSVTKMNNMFQQCGYTAMTSLDLSSGTSSTNTTQFNTSNVTNMREMFSKCGHNAMVTLNLGNNFDTGNVTNMEMMFYMLRTRRDDEF